MTLIRNDACNIMNPDVNRTGSRAFPAKGAGGFVAMDFEYAEKAQHSEERAVGAKITTPEVTDQDRQHDQNDEHPQSQGTDVGKEVQHLDVGHHVIGAVDEKLQGRRIHLKDDSPEEKGEQQIFQRAQWVVEPAGKPVRFAKNKMVQPV
jgi:hypothetical protein